MKTWTRRLQAPLTLTVAAAVLLAAPVAHAGVLAQTVRHVGDDPNLEHLGRELVRLGSLANGTVGVAAIHLETDRALFMNGDVRFPMASTYKVPIAVEILSRVDRGELSLDDMITLEEDDIVETAGTIASLLDEPGVILSVRNVLELMLQVSDNIATDLLFEQAGGSEAITGRMARVGAADIRVDRPTWAVISAFVGRPEITEHDRMSPDEYLRILTRERTPAQVAADVRAFNGDPRDTATPAAMGALLTKIWRKEILSAESSELLIDIMYRCQTGEGRLKGLLPPGTRVAHKTGTIGETTNDVGIIDLPGGAGHVVTVVYIKESKLPDNAAMEPVIAQIARAIHDYFAFNPGT